MYQDQDKNEIIFDGQLVCRIRSGYSAMYTYAIVSYTISFVRLEFIHIEISWIAYKNVRGWL